MLQNVWGGALHAPILNSGIGGVAVLIPCFNEVSTIAQTIESFKAFLPQADIFVYDNNSTDGSDEVAKAAGAIVRYEKRQGKGSVVRSMFRDIEADCYVLIDADNAFPADVAPKMVQLVLDDHFDMVIGDRLATNYDENNKRPFHSFGNRLIGGIVNKIFHSDVNDVMCGYRALSRIFVKTYPVLSDGFEIETEMTIHALDKRLDIINFPVQFNERPEGNESKLHTFNDGFKILFKIFTMYKDYRPFSFFGIIALVLFIVAGILFIPVFIAFLETSLVNRMPTLVVSGFLAMSSLLSLFCGLILDSIKRKNLQDFEITLNREAYSNKYYDIFKRRA